MYQNNQQYGMQNQMGYSNVNSQYRGLENKFQPIGNVQSQYNQNQNQNQNMSNQFQGSNQYSNFQSQSPQSYHTANYQGDQQGHDTYLRSDSMQPSQNQYRASFSNQANSYTNNIGSSYGSQQFAQQSPQSFHTANYRGDQQGHDSYLRSDSSQPAQNQYAMGANSYRTSFNNNSNQFGSSQNQGFNQSQSPQSYQTASYRGNQQGHDNYLRSDSNQPAQNQFSSNNSSFNRYQF
ncbi:hypothetical protein [Paenibacillus radicis (ex Xue et al. 2023)]|uniref:Uncharacterized protein n=1 Tax=Paenibacillus radicis (ex Xue et al. 2023) TaxID=2972489 RepID=A0ABT1YK65_9BACL|nr:hypothetical protein [Paenibacillus radicis (ex Xue et al. 2023)]MCR8633577.1 hypothetical protein [Paenibacillus radicis (ex Xue et al. 2023)]